MIERQREREREREEGESKKRTGRWERGTRGGREKRKECVWEFRVKRSICGHP